MLLKYVKFVFRWVKTHGFKYEVIVMAPVSAAIFNEDMVPTKIRFMGPKTFYDYHNIAVWVQIAKERKEFWAKNPSGHKQPPFRVTTKQG